MKDTLYIVMPAYNEEANIEEVIRQWHPICEKIAWYPITFRPRQGGVNSINMRRIFKIGIKAIGDFRMINKNLQ